MLPLAIAALAVAVEINDGLGHPAAFAALAVACVAAVIALRRPGSAVSARGLGIVVGLFGAIPWFNALPSATATSAGVVAPTWILVAWSLGATAVVVAAFDRLSPRTALFAAGAACALVGAWIIRAVPVPHIDVWWSQNAGIDLALAGGNPYTSSFPDLYDDPNGYALGIVRDGRVYLGYPYPPVSLLCDMPFRAVFGDIRWGHLVATLLTGAIIAGRRPDARSVACAGAFLLVPRQAFIIESAWMDPWVALFGVATMRLLDGPGILKGLVAGLFLASKPSMIPVVGAFLLAGLPARAFLATSAVALLAGAAVILPFRLPDPAAFDLSTWRVVAAMGTHPLSLSFPAPIKASFGVDAGAAVGFALAPLAAWWAGRRGARGPAVVAGGFAVGLLLFFSWNKFAWCNYYATVIALLAVACAMSEPSPPTDQPKRATGRPA